MGCSGYDVRAYGATGDGTTNDTSSFQDAIAAMPADGTLLIPDGTYSINPITITKAARIVPCRAAILKARSATNELGLITFQGTGPGASTTLVANAVRGDMKFKVDSTTSFVVGDWVRIEKDDAAPEEFAYEYARIKAIGFESPDDVLYLEYPLELKVVYPSGIHGVVTKVGMLKRVEVIGGMIDSNSFSGTNVSGIQLDYCVESTIDGVKFTNFKYVGLELRHCVFSRITGIQALDSTADLQLATPPDAGYGVSLRLSTAHSLVAEGRFRRCRHGVTIAEGAHSVVATGNDFLGCFSSPLETHNRRALQIVFAHNLISGDTFRSASILTTSAVSCGLQVSTTDSTVQIVGNVVLNIRGAGIRVSASALQDGHITISDNLLVECAPDATLGEGSIYVANMRHVTITNNRVVRSDTIDYSGIRVQGSEDVQLTGNDVIFNTSFSAASARCYYIVNSKRVTMAANAGQLAGSGQVVRVDSTNPTNSDTITITGTIANASGGATQLLVSANATNIRLAANSWQSPPGVSPDRGNTNVTLTAGADFETQRFATTLTANRTVSLSVTNVFNGARFRIVREGLGAFTLAVGGLKTIPANTKAFVDVDHDGTAWRLAGYGTL